MIHGCHILNSKYNRLYNYNVLSLQKVSTLFKHLFQSDLDLAYGLLPVRQEYQATLRGSRDQGRSHDFLWGSRLANHNRSGALVTTKMFGCVYDANEFRPTVA